MKYRKISLAVVVAVTLLLITSCDQLLSSLFGVTIEGRITALQTTLNTESRDGILDHFHPDMRNYKQLADDIVLVSGPLAFDNKPFVIGSPEVDENDVAVCSFLNGHGATGTIEFTMAMDGLSYRILILKLTLDNSSTVYELKRFLE